jgi:phospholipase C
VFDAYSRRTVARLVEPGRSLTWHWSLDDSFGWFDLTVEVESCDRFVQRLAGHVETGKDSMTDPLIGT